MKIKKIIATILISIMILGRVGIPVATFAEEPPVPPVAPEAPQAPLGPPPAPTGPQAPSAPTAPSGPSAPQAPTPPPQPEWNPGGNTQTNNETAPVQNLVSPETTPNNNNWDGTSSSGNVGDTEINTGDANNNSSILTTGNNNGAATGCCGEGGTSIVNSGNGAGSTNIGNSSSTVNNDNNQSNSAGVVNNLNQSSNTGGNDTSYNVGNSAITTGDANTTGTVVTSVNTNVDGVMISEFNIVDDHNGDIILDFGAGCIAGCGQNLALENSGNGAYSYNNASADSTVNNNTNQTNLANVGNDLVLSANSGYNDANFNTGGDSNITTGDANVSANAITFANNNIAGDIIYGVVNIFGDLVGDIILTQEMIDFICGGVCSGPTNVANSGNGAGSTNLANADSTVNNNVFQSNDANITNTLLLDANTGNNDTNFNTGGNSSINTGEANIDANILNIANLNLLGGNMWLVIVNEAGNWVGKLFGGSGGNVASSALLEFVIDPLTGGVTATNSGNGAGSANLANATSTTNNNINQTNTANINNTLDLTANTGGNTANYNTGGDSNITTGDADIVATIVNFVNNNIVGDGKLVITVVNVFGSWIGDFLTPGAQKEANNSNQGGVAAQSQNSSTNSGGSSSNNSASNGSNTNSGSVQFFTAGVAAKISGLNSFVSNFGGETDVQESSGDTNLIAGIAKANPVAANGMNINLAWLLLIIPAAAGMMVITRKLYIRRSNLS